MDPPDDVGVGDVPGLGRIAELEARREEHRAHRAIGEDRAALGEELPPATVLRPLGAGGRDATTSRPAASTTQATARVARRPVRVGSVARSTTRDGTVRSMIATCHHTVRVTEVDPPLDVCPSCIEEGGWWKHLRQCLICGKTGLLRREPQPPRERPLSAPRATRSSATRNPTSDWIWCFADEVNLRQTEGIWEEVDLFFEAGIWFADQAAEQTGTFDPGAGRGHPEGFPVGEFASAYREVRGHGDLDAEKTAALEAIPGWHW